MPGNSFPYVIIGGGMTADAAIGGVREVDADVGHAMARFSGGRFPPYQRPPLSKGLWLGSEQPETIWRKVSVEELGVSEHLGVRVVAIDPANHTVTDAEGNTYQYEKLLLATGGRAKRLPFGPTGPEGIIYYRTMQDYLNVRLHAARAERIIMVGGGFIGAEMAAALNMTGRQVTMIFPEETILERIMPHELGVYINDYFRAKGVQVLNGDVPVAFERSAERQPLIMTTRSGEKMEADQVVAGLGIAPDVEVAATAGLRVEDGIVVDEYARSSHHDVYAAGDVARYPAHALARSMRVEHEDHANAHGRLAGANMARARLAGDQQPYDHIPSFYSDMFELSYEGVGIMDGRLQTFGDWEQEPAAGAQGETPLEQRFRSGVVYYLERQRVVGVLLWRKGRGLRQARRLIEEGRVIDDPTQLRGVI